MTRMFRGMDLLKLALAALVLLIVSNNVLGQTAVENGGVVDAKSGTPITVQVQIGTISETEVYYKRISNVLGVALEKNSTLDGLLSHLGYSKPLVGQPDKYAGLLAEDLEKIASFDLMPGGDAEFEKLAALTADSAAFKSLLTLTDFGSDRMLVSRFFAPKISTYFNPKDPSLPIKKVDIVPGWRKLFRITPTLQSEAAKAGIIQHIYLLYNYKEKNVNIDPYAGNFSANNQVIIVPKDFMVGDRAFFLVYKGQGDGFKLGEFLEADFDLPGHAKKPPLTAVAGGDDGKYYVPRSCAECHGHSIRDADGKQLRGEPVDNATGKFTNDFSKGVYKFAKPNYLDTDQWYDWMNYDFEGVKNSDNDAIFDGTKDHASADYARAFDVIRKLNTTILEETRAAEKEFGVETFQTLAARRWLDIHRANDLPQDISKRSIGTESWDTAIPDEKRLLELLNNHCFRCHSSVRYNVFDRAEVKRLSGRMVGRMNAPNPPPQVGYNMPQGRVLEPKEREEMINLLKTIFP